MNYGLRRPDTELPPHRREFGKSVDWLLTGEKK